MGEKKTYEGGCHCGKVRYRATTDLGMAISCNCSICSKKASLLTFVGTDRFESVAGADELTDYQFNHHVIHHLFCRTCGITSYSRGKDPKSGKDMVAINLRCLDGLDLDTVKITPYDGKSR